jgi:uncharacterized protein (TIGR02996 family)
MSEDESAFLRAIRAMPADPVIRLAYADWLQERSDPSSEARSETIRIEEDLRNLSPVSDRFRALKARRTALRRRRGDREWIEAMGYAVRYDRELHAAIEQLYSAFGTIPKPRQIEGCPCCIDGKQTDLLLRKSLRQLTSDDLFSYAFSAFLTVGSEPDYLYFLPRILELAATDDSWCVDPAVTGRAIRSANPAGWAASQREALEDYLEALIGLAVQSVVGERIDDWICAMARMGRDVRPALDLIATSADAVLAFYTENADTLPREALANPFWEPPCAGYDAVLKWFHTPEIARIPFEAYGIVLSQTAS